MEKELYRAEEAAEALGLSRAQIYRLLAAKEIPQTRIRGSIRIPVNALRRWIEEHTFEPTGQ